MCNDKSTIANSNLLKFTKNYRGLPKITRKIATLLISWPGSVRKIGKIGGATDHAEHMKIGIDLYFYGGPGGEVPGSYQFSNKILA